MPVVTVEIRAQRLQRMLRQLAQVCSGDTLDGALRVIGEMLVRTARERIAAGVTPRGAAFTELSPVTISLRLKRGRGGARPLIDTGQLLDSGISYDIPEQNVLVIRASRKGAHAVQLGAVGAGRGRKVTIPARPFLGVSDADVREINAIILNIANRVRRGDLS